MTLLLHPIILEALAEARIADLSGERRPQAALSSARPSTTGSIARG